MLILNEKSIENINFNIFFKIVVEKLNKNSDIFLTINNKIPNIINKSQMKLQMF